MPGGREARHVAAEFGDDRLGGAAGHPGTRVEPGEDVRVGCGERGDVAIVRRDGLVEELDVAQEVVEREARGENSRCLLAGTARESARAQSLLFTCSR